MSDNGQQVPLPGCMIGPSEPCDAFQRQSDRIAELEAALAAEREQRGSSSPEDIARRFHDAYECLAPRFGYSTRPESRKEWDELPQNLRDLMIAVVRSVLIEQHAAEREQRKAAEALLHAKGEMLFAVVQGAKEEFVRVPYGASHEDVAAINEWHKMAAEALAAWENEE